MSPHPPAITRTLDLVAIRRRAIRTARAQARGDLRGARRRARAGREAHVWLWLPLTPLFLLLAPFALVLAPLGYLVPARLRPDPFEAVLSLGAVLLALGGTDVRVQAPGVNVNLKIF